MVKNSRLELSRLTTEDILEEKHCTGWGLRNSPCCGLYHSQNWETPERAMIQRRNSLINVTMDSEQ